MKRMASFAALASFFGAIVLLYAKPEIVSSLTLIGLMWLAIAVGEDK